MISVTHLSTSLSGGAGLGALRLHSALLNAGIRSRMVCSRNEDADELEGVSAYSMPRFARLRRIVPGVLRRTGLWTPPYYRAAVAKNRIRNEYGTLFSVGTSFYRLDRAPTINAAEIIHLHWVCGFLDIPSFFRRVRKPIIWTLRDEWPLLGGFHYRELVPPNLAPELEEEDHRQKDAKRAAFLGHGGITFVALSEESANFARTELHDDPRFPVFVIPNPVSEQAAKTKPPNRFDVRAALGLPQNASILLFVAQSLDEPRKGFRLMSEATEKLKRDGRNVVLVAIGRHEGSLPEGTIAPGFISNGNDLLRWYHAADVFVNPSSAEGCCKTLLDAQACGTPSVAFPHSGAKEAVGNTGGIVTDDFTGESLFAALKTALASTWDRNRIRVRALDLFRPETIARRHVELYKSILTNQGSWKK